MARRTLNRTELRRQAEAAEAAGTPPEAAAIVAPKKKKAPAKRKSKAKAAAEMRMRLFWGVYNQSLKLVAKYEYHQKKHAIKKADELSKAGKSPHFIQKVKEEIVEVVE